jgi:hypothetical protein
MFLYVEIVIKNIIKYRFINAKNTIYKQYKKNHIMNTIIHL